MTTEPELHFESNPREILRTSMNWIFNQPPQGLPFAFLQAIDDISDTVRTLTQDAKSADDKAWHRAALVTKLIMRDHDNDVVNEWLAAYSDLPPMKWPPK